MTLEGWTEKDLCGMDYHKITDLVAEGRRRLEIVGCEDTGWQIFSRDPDDEDEDGVSVSPLFHKDFGHKKSDCIDACARVYGVEPEQGRTPAFNPYRVALIKAEKAIEVLSQDADEIISASAYYKAGCAIRAELYKADNDLERSAKRAREKLHRAERAETGLGMGKCADCTHWTKPRHKSHWGYCTLSDEPISVVRWPWRGEPHQQIATKENFGCIRFQERES